MKCKKCGNEIRENTNFCSMCGNKVKQINKKFIMLVIFILLGITVVLSIGVTIGKNMVKDKTKLNNNNNETPIVENDKEKEEEEGEKNDIIDDIINKEYSYKLFQPSKIEIVANNDSELTKNIVINDIFFKTESTELGSYEPVYIYGKNNNSSIVEINLELNYYDKEGYRIERDTTEVVVSSGKEFVGNIIARDDSLEYETIKLMYTVKKLKSYKKEINLNEIEYQGEIYSDGDINVRVKNNSNTEMFFGNFACLYYKDNKIVYATNRTLTGLEPGMTNEVKFYKNELYLNKDYSNIKKIEYDDYKIILYSAFDSDSENY